MRGEQAERRLLRALSVDWGLELFDEHPSGLRLPKDVVSSLLQLADEAKALPGWTVLLEGHCPGRPEENNAIRESVGEEAADLCRLHLEKAGVGNRMVCTGAGSKEGLGMKVTVTLVQPEEPEDEDVPDMLAETCHLGRAETEAFVSPREVPLETKVEDIEEQAALERVETTTLGPDPGASADQEIQPAIVEEHTQDFAGEAKQLQVLPTQCDISRDARERSFAERLRQADSVKTIVIAGRLTVQNCSYAALDSQPALRGAFEQACRETIASASVTEPANVIISLSSGSVIVSYQITVLEGSAAVVHTSLVDALDSGRLAPDLTGALSSLRGISEAATGSLSIIDASMPTAADATTVQIKFGLNTAHMQAEGFPIIQELATAMHDFPDIGVLCVGHAKGRPADNNSAKRELSQRRAESQREMLLAHGVVNDFVCHGFGSALGWGSCVRFFPLGDLTREKYAEGEIRLPGVSSQSQEQQMTVLNQLLKEALDTKSAQLFEPNKASLSPSVAAPVVRRIASIIKPFPGWRLRCEGHAKGTPEDDNEAKKQLSQVRAESLRASLEAQGVSNCISCIGHGSSQGGGMCVKMFVQELEEEVTIPDREDMPVEQRGALLNQLLDRVLERAIEFEPNKSAIATSGRGTVRALARVLIAFPEFTIKCAGHAKGRPADNNYAKKKLSCARAEAVRAAVKREGVENDMFCVGEGSSQGVGMRVTMCVADPAEAPKTDVDIPDVSGLCAGEREALLNQLLEKTLEQNFEFEPNAYEVPLSAMNAIRNIARILNAFPDMGIRCEGHAKGKPEDDNRAKRKLSKLRAEAVRNALLGEGAKNRIISVGEGSAQGLGMRVRMIAADPAQCQSEGFAIPDISGMSGDEQGRALNELLAKTLEEEPIIFDPNCVGIQTQCLSIVEDIAKALKAFPSFPIRCEGHAKGRPADNNGAKVELSKRRAESVRDALYERGVTNDITCFGEGSVQGLGMRVRMFYV